MMDYVKLLERKDLDTDTIYEYNKVVVERSHGKILDIGCGTGRLMDIIDKSKGNDVFGIDINKNNVEFCKKKGLNARYGSITKIPFKEKTFDVVICWNLLEHLERDELMDVPKELWRVTKSGGKIIIHAPSFSKEFWDTPDHTYPVSKERIRKLFNTSNDMEFVNYHIPKIRGLLIGKLKWYWLYEFLLKILPFRGKGMTTVIITKK